MISNIILPLPFTPAVDYDDLLGIDMDQGAADMGAFIVPFKCEVHEAGAVVTEACAGDTTTPEVDFDKRPTAGSDTDRGAADVGHLILSTTAAGKVMYDKAGQGTLLYPGQEVVCQLAVASTGNAKAGHVRPYLLVKPVAETDANLSAKVLTA
jgi:hypothetical protein